MIKILEILNEDGTFALVSEHETIQVNLTDVHPELIMDDGSILAFDTVETYYTLIGDANVYFEADHAVDIEKLSENAISDSVANVSYKGYDVNKITKIEYQNGVIYYINRIIPKE